MKLEDFTYDDKVTRHFALATILWGFVALLLGVVIASQLFEWRLNFNHPWLTFGRLRPLHTNAAIFAFAGNGIFAGIYYSAQRLLKTRMFSDRLSQIHFWGWQLIIVLAAVTLPLGYTVGKEYAELEWPIALLITVIWVVFGVNFVLTVLRRREKHLYVAIWFYLATIITVALLHVVNSINIPVSFWKSYPIYAGVQDALVQWWYGHNAVAFVLTTPFLGLMYYFLPKAANKPIYSYRLSIIHFWSLVFVYIWAGPHHLLYTALPDWAQILGMVFSVMLIAPSWGGMINGLLSLRGAWDQVRQNPILKFFVAGLTFYGMATFEGPLLSIKSVNAIGHYTDWIIGHVHGGTLGWNGFMLFGMLYWMVPKLWKTQLHSEKMANIHFWFGFLGTVLYMISMWVAGVTQGLMWREMDEAGRLVYPDFIETVVRLIPLYKVRAFGGVLYLTGFAIMMINIFKTIRSTSSVPTDTKDSAASLTPSNARSFFEGKERPHRILESMPLLLTVLTFVAVLAGTIVELAPSLLALDAVKEDRPVRPYSPLQLYGRDIYIREGCYGCHSQMIRPLISDTKRYGDYSRPEESKYDHPFQWGSKRTGPDLARLGGKYPDLWHYRHMIDPREIVSGSIMPSYPWLAKTKIDYSSIRKRVEVMRFMGVPYSEDEVNESVEIAKREAAKISSGLQQNGIPAEVADEEITALIAYLQRLGK